MSENQEELQQRIAAYIDGELSPAEAARLEVYLANTDPKLADSIVGMLADKVQTRALPRPRAPADLSARILEQIERSSLLQEDQQAPRHPWWHSRAAIAAGLAVVLGGFSYFVANSVRRPTPDNSWTASGPTSTTPPVALAEGSQRDQMHNEPFSKDGAGNDAAATRQTSDPVMASGALAKGGSPEPITRTTATPSAPAAATAPAAAAAAPTISPVATPATMARQEELPGAMTQQLAAADAVGRPNDFGQRPSPDLPVTPSAPGGSAGAGAGGAGGAGGGAAGGRGGGGAGRGAGGFGGGAGPTGGGGFGGGGGGGFAGGAGGGAGGRGGAGGAGGGGGGRGGRAAAPAAGGLATPTPLVTSGMQTLAPTTDNSLLALSALTKSGKGPLVLTFYAKDDQDFIRLASVLANFAGTNTVTTVIANSQSPVVSQSDPRVGLQQQTAPLNDRDPKVSGATLVIGITSEGIVTFDNPATLGLNGNSFRLNNTINNNGGQNQSNYANAGPLYNDQNLVGQNGNSEARNSLTQSFNNATAHGGPYRVALSVDQLAELSKSYRLAVLARGDVVYQFHLLGDKSPLTADARQRALLLQKAGLNEADGKNEAAAATPAAGPVLATATTPATTPANAPANATKGGSGTITMSGGTLTGGTANISGGNTFSGATSLPGSALLDCVITMESAPTPAPATPPSTPANQ